RLNRAGGYAHYRMAELEPSDAPAADTVFGQTFEQRLEEATRELRVADAAHPNHYAVLQLLGLVYSEPRRDGANLNIAEQYFERAIGANPSDAYGHELLADLLLRRAAAIGVDVGTRGTIEKGMDEAQAAIRLREVSGPAHLLRAQFQIMLLEIERNETRRRELRVSLQQYMDQADRFLPRAFKRPDVDLSWLRVIAATRRLVGEAEAPPQMPLNGNPEQRKLQLFDRSRAELRQSLLQLGADCEQLEKRWVDHQRVFHVRQLEERAKRLNEEIDRATVDTWREIQVPFL